MPGSCLAGLSLGNDGCCQACCTDRPAILRFDFDSPELHPTPEFQWTGRADDFATANAVHVRRINIYADDSVSLVAGE